MSTRAWFLVIALVGFFGSGWVLLRKQASDSQRKDDRALEEAKQRELRHVEQAQAAAADAAAPMTMQEYERGLGAPHQRDAGRPHPDGSSSCQCKPGDPLCTCL